MKKYFLLFFVLIAFFPFASCKKEKTDTVNLSKSEVHNHEEKVVHIDTTQFDAFFKKYPNFKEFEPEIRELYKKHNHYIWHDKNGLIEFADVLHNQASNIQTEGLKKTLPYKEQVDELFSTGNSKPDMESELLVSAMYFYYANTVFKGLDTQASKETGWYLPRDRVDYVSYLDTLMKKPSLIKEDKSEMYGQYYNLKKGLERYKELEKKGGWPTNIALPEGTKSIKVGDSATTVAQVRKRLFAEGYLKTDSGKAIFDNELVAALAKYEKVHHRTPDNVIGPKVIKELNIPVSERIKTISVNMERCRWVPSSINKEKEYIAVNIPSYRLFYFRDKDTVLVSKVVVGKELNKTVIFSGQMSYLAFSPYWNVPTSILNKEIKPAIAKDPDYLSKHNMEWAGNRVRQKPGKNNSLGLVKFMFPNSNNIYLHDTPAKSLFNKDERALSHGCVRVERARDLAIAITKKDGGWNEKRVDAAMHKGKENTYNLKTKIPVYLTYFTAWADENGNVIFFEDIYNRDNRLADMLYN